MAATMREKVREVIDQMGEEVVPKHMKKRLEDTLDKMYVEGKWPKDALGIPPESLESLYQHAYQLFQGGKYREALTCFSFLRQIDPPSFRYHFGVAACHHYLKEYDEAAGNYLFCTYMDVLNPVPFFHLYDCFVHQNDPYSALYALEKTILRAEGQPQFAVLKERAKLEKQKIEKEIAEKEKSSPSAT